MRSRLLPAKVRAVLLAAVLLQARTQTDLCELPVYAFVASNDATLPQQRSTEEGEVVWKEVVAIQF